MGNNFRTSRPRGVGVSIAGLGIRCVARRDEHIRLATGFRRFVGLNSELFRKYRGPDIGHVAFQFSRQRQFVLFSISLHSVSRIGGTGPRDLATGWTP